MPHSRFSTATARRTNSTISTSSTISSVSIGAVNPFAHRHRQRAAWAITCYSASVERRGRHSAGPRPHQLCACCIITKHGTPTVTYAPLVMQQVTSWCYQEAPTPEPLRAAYVELPGTAGEARHFARGDDLPGGQARDPPRRGGPAQYPLPQLPRRWAWRPTRPAWRSAPPWRSASFATCPRLPPPGAARAARRLLPAARRARHRQRRDP